MPRSIHFALILLTFSFFISNDVFPCSMYKLTKDGKTLVGCNEDAWRITPHIWFESGIQGNYSCCFTGSRSIGKNKYAAQSGMNEHGLVFTRLGSYHPEKPVDKTKKKIEHPDLFLMQILKSCKNTNEVKQLYEDYDRSCFINDVFVYVEPSGRYIIVEPYNIIDGFDSTLVQANFCPSITPEKDRERQKRYLDGKKFLENGYQVSTSFCRELSSEMHVCRDKIGDGTLLTSIWDSEKNEVTIYFYHDYSEKRVFSLEEEFQKGDHQIAISSIFPENAEFEQLKSYITPFNTDWIRITLALIGVVFMFSSLFFGIRIFRKKEEKNINAFLFLIFNLSFWYMLILTTNIEVYYFPAPYVHYSSNLISIASYIPYLMLIGSVGIIIMFLSKKLFTSWGILPKGILFMNIILFLVLSPMFFYWGLIY